MEKERDEPHVLGQVAGIIAMMSALVRTLPPSTRKRLLNQVQVEFDALLTSMSATDASQVRAERESVEWMRDLFLKKIEELNNPQPARRVSRRKAGASRKPAPEYQPPAAERQAPKDVDFEL